jgi:hypothetical protein
MGESKVMGESRLNDIVESEEQQVSTPSRYFQRSQVNKQSKDSPQAPNQQPTEDRGSMQ